MDLRGLARRASAAPAAAGLPRSPRAAEAAPAPAPAPARAALPARTLHSRRAVCAGASRRFQEALISSRCPSPHARPRVVATGLKELPCAGEREGEGRQRRRGAEALDRIRRVVHTIRVKSAVQKQEVSGGPPPRRMWSPAVAGPWQRRPARTANGRLVAEIKGACISEKEENRASVPHRHREPARQQKRPVSTWRSRRACCRLTSDYRARRSDGGWTGRRGRAGWYLALVSAEMPPPVENGLRDEVGIRGHGDVVGAVHVGVGHGLEPRADVLRVLQGHVASAGELQIRASRCQVSNATASVQR